MDIKGDLILLRGLPGSGKSTLGEIIMSSPGNHQLPLSADDFFTDSEGNYNFDPTKLKEAHNQCKQRCALLMQNNSARIVVSNTFTQEWEMEEYIEMAKRYGYRVHTVIVENRHGGTNIHGVPDDKLQVMKERFSIQL